jgi:hypothetical protein
VLNLVVHIVTTELYRVEVRNSSLNVTELTGRFSYDELNAENYTGCDLSGRLVVARSTRDQHQGTKLFFSFSSSSSSGPGAYASDALQPVGLLCNPVNPPVCLDVPTVAAKCLHVFIDARDPSCERWNLRAEMLSENFA